MFWDVKRPVRLAARALLAIAILAVLYLWAFSRPRSPLQLMVAGTLATTVALGAVFVQLVMRGHLTAPKVVEPEEEPASSIVPEN